MDNIQGPVQAPQGQAPTGGQVPNVQAQGTAQAPQQAEGPGDGSAYQALASKKGFKTPDDLAKAYESLEKKSSETSMQKADLERLLFGEDQRGDGKGRQPQESRTTPTSDELAMAELDRFVGDRIQKERESLQRDFDMKLARIELEREIERHPDLPKYAPEIKDIKARNPGMSFGEAYLLAKARKGDLAQEAKSEGMREGAQVAIRQQQAQVAPEKQTLESKLTPAELLQGAGKRWTPDNRGRLSPQQRAEIEMVERELFGEPLMKTPSGL